MNKNFIQRAIKRPGALTNKAKRAKMSVKKFTEKVLRTPTKYTTRTVRQARLAKTLRKITNKNKKKK